MFSSRVLPHGDVNAITRAVERLRASETAFIDLTESNPTQADLPYPPDLLTALADPRALRYEPQARGILDARVAVAAEFERRGALVDPAHLVLSASTSETYSWLFKLLCEPGDTVLIPRPSYPLFDYLTRLEGVMTESYHLSYHGRWELDVSSLADAPDRTRAILAVSPNNPTGSFLSPRDRDDLFRLCRERGWALIVDEVFADYAVDAQAPLTDLAASADVLTFSLGGASKSIGLPQVKLGWTLVGGPAAVRDQALAALEVIADTFLSVSTPVQVGAARLLREGASVRAAIQHRIHDNLVSARRLAATHPACDLLPIEGGWSLIVRVPAHRNEEAIVLDLLEQEHVLVHPGFFFDLPHEAFLVISLLPRADQFTDGFDRVLRHVNSQIA